jgi:hypothetical protein
VNPGVKYSGCKRDAQTIVDERPKKIQLQHKTVQQVRTPISQTHFVERSLTSTHLDAAKDGTRQMQSCTNINDVALY